MPDAPQTVTLAIKMLDEAMEIPSYPISAFDSFYEAIDRMRKIRDVLDAGGAAERGEDREDAERWRVFAEVVRTTGHVAFERFRDGEEERKVLSIEWGDDSTCEPWDFSPLEEWIDARVVAARRASTAPQEGGEKP